MATGNCQDGGGACTMAADWSVGVPIASSDALVWQDDALDSVITIASLANSSEVDFVNADLSTTLGNATNAGRLNLDAAGDGV